MIHRRANLFIATASIFLAPAAVASSSLAEFKKTWEQTWKIEDYDKRLYAQTDAIESLRGPGSPEVARELVAIALDRRVNWWPHERTVAVLSSMTAEPARAWIATQATQNEEGNVRALLCGVAATWPAADAEKTLFTALGDANPNVVAAAADGLSRIRDKTVVAFLIGALEKDRPARSRDDIVIALTRLTGMRLRERAEWSAWWSEAREKFSFAAVAPTRDADAETSVPRTTDDGSGLWDKITSERVQFVIDVLGSMATKGKVASGKKTESREEVLSRLEYVKRELCAAIDVQLAKATRFDVIAFSDEVIRFKPHLVDATDANRAAAKAWIEALEPHGETNAYGALEAAFADKSVDTIYFLSDGSPTSGEVVKPDWIRGRVRDWNAPRHLRIHTIAYLVGKAHPPENKRAARAFMAGLAEESGGTHRTFE